MSDTVNSGTQDDHFVVEQMGDITVFRITRAARLNALTRPALIGLAQCVDELEARGGAALIITAQGERAFCAGTDLAELQTLSGEQRNAKSRTARALFHRIQRAPFISVAAINGLAFGGGLELALACLFRVAAPQATFSLPEIKLGVLPAYGGTQFLPPVVGQALALDMMLTGRVLDAREALAAGLVSRISETSASVLHEAMAMAELVGNFGRDAVASIRRCVAAAGAQVTDAGLGVEDTEVIRCMGSADAKEGVAAFLEKRAPRFNQKR